LFQPVWTFQNTLLEINTLIFKMRNMEFNQLAGFYFYIMFLMTNLSCIRWYPVTVFLSSFQVPG